MNSPVAEEFPYELGISEQSGVRNLHFGSEWIQGAMRIRQPYALELAYTREMMACLLLRGDPGWPRNALLIGLGAGSLAKFIHQHLAQTHITAVEIDSRIIPMAQHYFHLPEDPRRLDIVIADAAEYIGQSSGPYDAIFVDGYGPDGHIARLDTLEFYAACREKLTLQGLMICNLLSRDHGYAASAERIHKAFEKRSTVFPSLDCGNAVAFAASGEAVDVSLAEMRAQANELKKRTGLNLGPTITRLQLVRPLPKGRLKL